MAFKNPYGDNPTIPPEAPSHRRRARWTRVPTLFDRLISGLVWLFTIFIIFLVTIIVLGMLLLFMGG